MQTPTNNDFKKYRYIRSHKINKIKINELIRPSSSHPQAVEAYHINTICQIIQKQNPSLFVDCMNKKLAIYDRSSYVECRFDNLYRDLNKKNIWMNISPEITNDKNYLLVYLHSASKENGIFINQILIKDLIKQQNKKTEFDQDDFGIVEKTIIQLLTMIDKDQDQQLLISVVGFTQSNLIDLLNFDQDFSQKIQSKLRIKKQKKSVMVENLSQIAIDSIQAFYNIYLLCCYIKEIYSQQTGNKIQTQIFQIFIGKLSKGKTNIQNIKTKYNFVKIHSDQSIFTNAIGSCFKQIVNQKAKVVSNRNTKLTFFLEDCLNKNSNIRVFSEIDLSQNFKSQINILSFSDYFNRCFNIHKNYLGNETILSKIKKYGNQRALLDLTVFQNRQANIENLKKFKYHTKYVSKINHALMSQTLSSISKRRKSFVLTSPIKSSQKFFQRPQGIKPLNFSTKLTTKEKNNIIKKVYRDV